MFPGLRKPFRLAVDATLVLAAVVLLMMPHSTLDAVVSSFVAMVACIDAVGARLGRP